MRELADQTSPLLPRENEDREYVNSPNRSSSKVQLTVRFNPETARWIEKLSQISGISEAAVVRRLINKPKSIKQVLEELDIMIDQTNRQSDREKMAEIQSNIFLDTVME